ncbi:MAG TPA: baseplate J/gp47 family protein [Chloroflexia bacterium]|nr:baseplate J/gp47 family protein [Chloroflexia bacterium]
MPLTIPNLDDRRYQDLLDEALARIPISTPEWTNFNKSDPGVTLIEVFAFLTENLLYRSNQIPERNRRKFLSLLGIPLQPATAAQGLVTFNNERGPLQNITLNGGLEVRAGQIPFLTQNGLDVLPVEARVFYKKEQAITGQAKNYYQQFYLSYLQPVDLSAARLEPQIYQTLPLAAGGSTVLDLGTDTIDGALWIALLLREADKPYSESRMRQARQAIGGKTINLGVVPALSDPSRDLPAGRIATGENPLLLQVRLPVVSETKGLMLSNPNRPEPQYLLLPATATQNVLVEPGIVQVTLPEEQEIGLWSWANLNPHDAGVGNLPPSLEDSSLSDRVITWLRVSVPNLKRPDSTSDSATAVRARFSWLGINAAQVSQRARVSNELLSTGTGEPDQSVTLSRAPVLPGSLTLSVTTINGQPEAWQAVDDLMSAGPEVPLSDTFLPSGSRPVTGSPVKVFTLNPESGEVRFGDGTHGARPPLGAVIRASYDISQGQAGNVAPGAINTSPALPPGLTVANPIPTRGGAASESAEQGEKQITRYLQHRDRLVNKTDFETITLRTPGLDIGRVEVLPTYNPDLASGQSGDAPGAVTLMVIPRYDPRQPNAPQPDQLFLDTICDYLDPRRLVTTEVFLRGPTYVPVWISVGLQVVAERSIAEVREAVKKAVQAYLSPLPPDPSSQLDNQMNLLNTPDYGNRLKGWPLNKAVVETELLTEISRVPGVLSVKALLGDASGVERPSIPMQGLQLPRIAALEVSIGDPLALAELQGQQIETNRDNLLPVPAIPEEC